MLILTRKLGEGVRIGDEIEVRVMAIEHSRVKLGIDAPRDVAVWRREIWLQIQQDGREERPR